MPPNTQQLMVRIPCETHRRLKTAAAREVRTMSQVVDDLVTQYLDETYPEADDDDRTQPALF